METNNFGFIYPRIVLSMTLKLVIDRSPPWCRPNKQLQAGGKHILKSNQNYKIVPLRTIQVSKHLCTCPLEHLLHFILITT